MSENNTVLYRKYRPSAFAEVRDQDHIVTVLEGAIKKKTIPHALLFCGGRGTGKTTLARIFAQEIGTSSVDLYEIDAASNRGIDDIRELKEAVHTLPYESERKVYIIDEVHMLTKEAFNALLKTLEEPPAHVVFILATTEVDKLLDTILSRCQVFTMRSPSRATLAAMVSDVAKKEKFKLGKGVAELIATAADGSFRDALGTLEKVILGSHDSQADADEVAVLIGAPQTALLSTMLKALHEKDASAGLAAVGDALANHVEMKLFMRLLLERVRAVMLLRNSKEYREKILATFSEEEQAELTAYTEDTATPLNSHLLVKLLTAATQMTRSQLPHIALEVAIVEHCES